MDVISTTIRYKGTPVKVKNGRIFLQSFGTTINNHSMHWSWQEIEKSNLKKEFKQFLEENNLI